MKSILSPPEAMENTMVVVDQLRTLFPTLQSVYLPRVHEIPYLKGISWVPTWPNSHKQLEGKRWPLNPFTTGAIVLR